MANFFHLYEKNPSSANEFYSINASWFGVQCFELMHQILCNIIFLNMFNQLDDSLLFQ